MAGKLAVFWMDSTSEAQLWAGGWPSECWSRNVTDFPSRCDTPRRLLSFMATLTITLAAGTPYLRTGAKKESLHWQLRAHWKSLGLGKAGNSWGRSWMMDDLRTVNLDATALSTPTKARLCFFGALALSDLMGCYREVLAVAQVSPPRLFHFPDNRHMGFFKCKNVTVYTCQL